MRLSPAPLFVLRVSAALALVALAATCSTSSGGGTGTGGASSSSGSGGGSMEVQPPACPPTPATGDFPCDVGGVIAAKCQPCHQMPIKHGAHFPLLTYEDTQQVFVPSTDGGPPFLRWMRMYQVIQPGFIPHMPSNVYPACDAGLCQLDDAELKTLDAWFQACVSPKPEGTGCDVGEVASDAGADH
jgi:hypothetical protein